MINKIAAAFEKLLGEVNSLRAEVRNIPVARDGISPDPAAIAADVESRIRVPKDGISPDVDALVARVVEQVPPGPPGKDAQQHALADVAALVFNQMPPAKPGKDGVSPDPAAIADNVQSRIRVPKDGVSPDPAAVAKLVHVPAAADGRDGRDGKPGKPGKDGKSITKMSVDAKNVLYVWIDGKKQTVGQLTMPRPQMVGGGGGALARSPGARREQIVTVTTAYTITTADDVVMATGGGYAITLPATNASIKRVQITSRTGTVVLTPAGSDLVDGATTVNLAAGQSRTLTPINGEWVTG